MEERERRIEEYERSGLTQREFAERAGIGRSTLTYWLRRGRPKESAAAGAEWVELRPGQSGPSGCREASGSCRVCFPSGVTVELAQGFCPEAAARLCRALGEL